jgi:hypothetical protein
MLPLMPRVATVSLTSPSHIAALSVACTSCVPRLAAAMWTRTGQPPTIERNTAAPLTFPSHVPVRDPPLCHKHIRPEQRVQVQQAPQPLSAMNRFVFTCPETGVVILTDKKATLACVEQLRPYPLRVYCPACHLTHDTTYSECKPYPLRSRISIDTLAS